MVHLTGTTAPTLPGEGCGGTPALARAYADEPVKVLVWGDTGRAFEISRADPAVRMPFHWHRVFRWDAELYARLKAVYDAGDRGTLLSGWEGARPFHFPTRKEDADA